MNKRLRLVLFAVLAEVLFQVTNLDELANVSEYVFSEHGQAVAAIAVLFN